MFVLHVSQASFTTYLIAGGDKGIAVVELLLQAHPEAASLKGQSNYTPLALVQKRTETEFSGTTQLSASDPLIVLLKAGG